MSRKRILAVPLAALAVAGGGVVAAGAALAGPGTHRSSLSADQTRTPIKHLVVIFQENVSFDHYFGTYPNGGQHRRPAVRRRAGHAGRRRPAAGDRRVAAGRACGTATDLLTEQPERVAAAAARQQPHGRCRAAPGGQLTCDQDHNYSDEQQAFDGGQMDQFVQSVGTGGRARRPFGTPCDAEARSWTTTTATPSPALWNYAQHYAMSDNSYGTTFGPSAPGAINLVVR